MWNRLAGTGSQLRPATSDEPGRRAGAKPGHSLGRVAGAHAQDTHAASVEARAERAVDRRAYYRVGGLLPIRVTPIASEEIDAAIFDLSLPDPLLQPIGEEESDSPLAARMRRIEEKLDLLLGELPGDRPRALSGRDRRPVVFSGSGLRLDVEFDFAAGDAFRIEILLPPPYLRTLRAVGFAVGSSESRGGTAGPLAVELRHMEDEERDALVAYSYDLQRFALRHRSDAP